jgi:hypothetical protein
MLELSILGIALFIVAVIIAGFVWWIIRYVLVELPKRQQDILNRFSPCVVNEVMMKYGILPEYQQKQIAVERMRNIFDDECIDQPGDAMMEAAISDAMYRKKMQEANEWIEELKKDNLIETNTMEMPITPREDFVL